MSDWVTVKSKKKGDNVKTNSNEGSKERTFVWNGPLTTYKGPCHSDKYLAEGLRLLRSGAKWGDMEVYSIQENDDILKQKTETEIIFGF